MEDSRFLQAEVLSTNKLDVILKCVLISLVVVLTFFVGLFFGQIKDLRRQDSNTIKNLRASVQILSSQNKQFIAILNTVSRKDSLASTIIKNEIAKFNATNRR